MCRCRMMESRFTKKPRFGVQFYERTSSIGESSPFVCAIQGDGYAKRREIIPESLLENCGATAGIEFCRRAARRSPGHSPGNVAGRTTSIPGNADAATSHPGCRPAHPTGGIAGGNH